jgi:hypothetical protein
MGLDQSKAFWDWFQENSLSIHKHLETDTENIALDIKSHLQQIDPNLEFEIPFEYDSINRPFIVSADGDADLFPKVIAFVESAPMINGWDIIAFRPRLHQRNQVIDLDGLALDYHDIFFHYEIHKNSLKLDVYINGYDQVDQRFVHVYFLLLDSLIGEFDSVTMIQETTIHPLREKKGLHSFPELLDIVDNLKKSD